MALTRVARSRAERLIERSALDYLGAVVSVGVLLAAARFQPHVDVLAELAAPQRAELYSKLIGPLSIVASIGTAALAVYAAAQGPRMTLLRAVHGERLVQQFRGAAVAPGLAVVALIVAYVAELTAVVAWPRWLALGAFIFVLLRALRVLYFYTGLLVTAGEDKDTPARRPSIDDLPVPTRR